VGGNGGYGASGYRYSIGACASTTQTTRRSTSQHYGGHVQVDMAEGSYSLGAQAGLTVAGTSTATITHTTEEDPDTGESFTYVSDTSRAFVADWRIHLIPRAGIHTPYLNFVGGVGFSWAAGVAPEHALLPALDYEIEVGRLGLVAYWGKGQFLGFTPNDFHITNGVSFLGGDYPAIQVGLRTGFHDTLLLVRPVPMAELGVASPRHWPVKFQVTGAIGRAEYLDELSWDVQGEIALVFGKRPKQSALPVSSARRHRVYDEDLSDL